MDEESLYLELNMLEQLLTDVTATHQYLISKQRKTILELNALVGSCTQCDGEGCTYCK